MPVYIVDGGGCLKNPLKVAILTFSQKVSKNKLLCPNHYYYYYYNIMLIIIINKGFTDRLPK